jgi:small subunit ribosomal protein S8
MISLDSISDYISRIKNANVVYNKVVEIPSNKILKEISRILRMEGFINDYQVYKEYDKEKIKIYLKYGHDKSRCISNILRVSKPGRRCYVSFENLPKVKRGIGVAIISTSQGLMTDKQARKSHLGGEVFCYVW